jgi:hypothetical protein
LIFRSLGLLNYIRIWHDNTGQGSSASWFLKYIIVRDLQTMETFHFISQQWFAVEKEDGRVSYFTSYLFAIKTNRSVFLLICKRVTFCMTLQCLLYRAIIASFPFFQNNIYCRSLLLNCWLKVKQRYILLLDNLTLRSR